MNNREAYSILAKNISSLSLKSVYHGLNTDPSYTFSELGSYRRALVNLRKFNLISDALLNLKNLNIILDSKEETISTTFSPGYDIEANAKMIYQIINNLIKFLENQSSEDDENAIDIKIVKIEDLDELERIANLLKKSFSFPVNPIGGKVTVNSLEKGSVWIVLGIVEAGNLALKMCASLIWSAAVVYKKLDDIKINQIHLKNIKLDETVTKHIIEQENRHIEDIKDREALAIANEYSIDNDPETILRLKLAIESIGELIEKGVEFYPSIKATDDVKALFPDFTMIKLIESKTKLLDLGE